MFKAWTNPEKGEEPKDRDPSGLLDQEAWKRRMIWERAISRERSRSHPDQVLKIKQKELTRSKCQALPFIQNIFQKNCALLRIPNKFCFGQCNSFYLPGWPSSLPQPCASCVPSHSRRRFVTLRCQGGKRSRVAVEMIEECECLTRYGNEDETAPFGRTEGFLPL
ncbi:DAN domain family member 5-like [Bombina bombina]|uniref:DAN domain family member 5-like n=1 Tax=Bombina bombina TaxID=8345 RepID=UPI00235A69C5|nr:DAN domain family member 5-like [Bombina bombina]